MYYRVKFADKEKYPTDWYFSCKIPSQLIRQFHANRTMQGKRRKRPLREKQHKFFDPQVNSVGKARTCDADTQTDTSVNLEAGQKLEEAKDQVQDPEPVPVAGPTSSFKRIRFVGKKPYYLMKGNSEQTEWCTVHAVSDKVRDLIEWLQKSQKQWLVESCARIRKNDSRKRRQAPDDDDFDIECDFDKLPSVYARYFQEVYFNDNGSVEAFITYKSSVVPPEWVPLRIMPTMPMTQLIKAITEDYKKEILSS